MAIRSSVAVLRQIETLFQVGVIGDLTDAQLMERFKTLDREAAEQAFAAIVERHGPMVLHVCKNLLKNPQDAEDAFQATFFILARKARFVWVRDSLAPWLHRVARRVAARARASALRRREHERRAAELKLKVVHADDHADDLLGLLHAEIDRLPERYRAAFVVCDMEGLSHERAARQLGWPVGTVKSRLARARQILRSRLTARDLAAPAILLLFETATRSVDAAVASAMVNSTLRSALIAPKAPMIGVVSVSVANLAEEVIPTMFLTKSKLTWAGVLIACALTAGTVTVLGRQGDGSNPKSASGRPAAKRASIATPMSKLEDAPDFIQQSRGMIITRLEQELALARTRLDRTLRRVSAPNDPAVVQARRTVAEIEFQLARIDGELVNAVDRFPTMFDFSGGQVDLNAGPGSAKSGTVMPHNVNDVYQASAGNSGNPRTNKPNDFAPGENADPFGGANQGGAQGRVGNPFSNGKSGDGQGKNSAPHSGQNAKSSANSQQQTSQDQPQSADKNREQNPDQSRGQSSGQNPRQDTSQPPQQDANKHQRQNGGQPGKQNAGQPPQEDANQPPLQHNATATGGAYNSKNRKANGAAALDLTVSEGTRTVDDGGQANFEIRLRNQGTRNATHLLVTANLSRNLEFLRGGGASQDVTVFFRPRTNELEFERIDRIGPGEEILLRVVARVTGQDPKLATCGASVTHDDLPKGEKLEDMAAIKVTKPAGLGP